MNGSFVIDLTELEKTFGFFIFNSSSGQHTLYEQNSQSYWKSSSGTVRPTLTWISGPRSTWEHSVIRVQSLSASHASDKHMGGFSERKKIRVHQISLGTGTSRKHFHSKQGIKAPQSLQTGEVYGIHFSKLSKSSHMQATFTK